MQSNLYLCIKVLCSICDLINSENMHAFPKGNKLSRGRPKGSTTKPQISKFITRKEVLSLMATAKKMAANGDSNMVRFLLDHTFGKAPQSIEANVIGSFSLTEVFNRSKDV